MKSFFVTLTYTAQATARFEIDEHQLKDALGEERFGKLKGEDWEKAETLFSRVGEDIANEISDYTWECEPIELGSLNFTLRQDYRTEEALEEDTSEEGMYTEIEPSEVFLKLSRVAWLDDVEVEEHDSND